MTSQFPFAVGDTVLCTAERSDHLGKIGIIAEIHGDYEYTVRSLTNGFIGSPLGWTQPASWKKIPSNTRPMTDADIVSGTKVVCIRATGYDKSVPGIVGIIDRISGSPGKRTWYVRTPDNKYVGGGYWSNTNYFLVVLDDEETKPIESDFGNRVGATATTVAPTNSNPCPRKYSGLDECTCGTCPPKKKNPYFFKMQ